MVLPGHCVEVVGSTRLRIQRSTTIECARGMAALLMIAACGAEGQGAGVQGVGTEDPAPTRTEAPVGAGLSGARSAVGQDTDPSVDDRPPRSVPPRIDQCGFPRPAVHSVAVQRELIYRQVGSRSLAMDLYRPAPTHNLEATAAMTTVVLVHGGGWRAGERAHVAEEATALASWGFAAVALDYRILPEGVFPAAVSDVRCALRYLSAQADALELDATRIVPVGFSAGGHLVALASLAPFDERLDDIACPASEPVRPAGFVSYFTPFEFRDLEAFPRGSRRLVERFLGGATPDDPVAAVASPIAHVTEAAPPAVLIHGDADRVVPLSESESMVAALEARDVPVRFVDLASAGHGFRMLSAAAIHRPAFCTVMAFLEQIRGAAREAHPAVRPSATRADRSP